MKNRLKRRDFVKLSALGAATGTLGLACRQPGAETTGESETERVAQEWRRVLQVAGYDYDRVRGIMDGRLLLEGFDLNFNTISIYDANRTAFVGDRAYEITEIGLIPYVRRYINEGFRAYSLVPVFISRVFRHGNVFVHVDSGIERPEDLRGKRVGTPGYGYSSNTWIRGFLQDEYGVRADEMRWIETTNASDGSVSGPTLNRHHLPADFPLEKGPEGVDESELILSGGCDALITAITPKAYLDRDPRVRRLFPDLRAVEQAYYRKTGLFPIMHAVAVRNDAIEADPTLPKQVFEMYSTAKQEAYARLESTTSLKTTLPWSVQEFEDTQEIMGRNFWPYGIPPNRDELDRVMRYAHEQGLVNRRIGFEEMFHPSTLELVESDT